MMLSRVSLGSTPTLNSMYSRFNIQHRHFPPRLRSAHLDNRKASICPQSTVQDGQLLSKAPTETVSADAAVERSTPTQQPKEQSQPPPPPIHQARSQIEDMISSLPLIRYLRSATKQSPSHTPTYKELRPYQTMHPSARSIHLVVNSLFSPAKLPLEPYFFIRSHQGHRVIATCYVGSHLCGHAGYVHGGLPFLLFDDVFARCAGLLFESGVAMTANMNIDFRKPAVPERVYVYRAEIVRIEGRKAWVTGQMRCMDPFSVDEMLRRKAAASDEVSGEEEKEGALVAEATALFVEPKFGKSMVKLFSG